MGKSDERFVIKEKEGGMFSAYITQVIVDKETGVNYLLVTNGVYVGGLTPLIDANGKPIVTLNTQ